MTGRPLAPSGSDEVRIRPFRDEDLDAVVALLGEALGPAPGGADRADLFVWKHLANPFGRSVALVAEVEGRVAGLRAFMHWDLVGPTGTVRAVRAVDTATAPGLQRRGIFSRLTREALDACAAAGVTLVFNTPNERSLPGYLKLGWTRVTTWPVRVRVRRPVRFGLGMAGSRPPGGAPISPPPGSSLLEVTEELVGERLAAVARDTVRPAGALATPRTPAYLAWRYGRGPIPYHTLIEGEVAVVLRLRSRGRLAEAVIDEVFAPPGPSHRAARVLAAAVRASAADHAVAHFGPGWPGRDALARAGFLPIPGRGMAFAVRPVGAPGDLGESPGEGPAGGPDPREPGAWSLTLGDLEVF